MSGLRSISTAGGRPVSDEDPLPVSGLASAELEIPDGNDEAQGATADAAETDPTASATIVALLKGILRDLQPPAHSEAVDVSGDDYTPDQTTRALIVGTAGDVVVDTADGQTEVTIPLPAGQWSMKVTQIYSDGTTAGGIVAQW